MPPRLIRIGSLLLAGGLALTACGGGHKAPKAAPTSASPTPSATPTATPVVATCPLTGTPRQSGQDIHRPALAVKIDNINVARPQAGIDHADVVVEELVEGGLTRLFAVFQCDTASNVGPIRSARTSDADLLALLHGSVFGFSGSNPSALPPIRAHGDTVLISYDALSQYYHRDHSRPAPHNVFSSTATILGAGVARRKGLHAPKPLFAYGPFAGGRPVHSVAISWPEQSAGWTWSSGAWQRTQNGSPDMVTSGSRVHAANVVILSIAIGSTGLRDVLGNASPLNETTGHGTAWVLRDGKVIRGSWRRTSPKAPLRLYGPAGRPLPLHPGRTWVELLPRGRAPSFG